MRKSIMFLKKLWYITREVTRACIEMGTPRTKHVLQSLLQNLATLQLFNCGEDNKPRRSGC
jgi:hypothetical protein